MESIHDDSIHAEELQAEPARIPASTAKEQTVDALTEFLTETPNDELAINIKHVWYLPVRAICDWLLALVLLVVAIPIIAVTALVVKLTSRGPAFYCQKRVGKKGRTFTLIKLRTMVDDAEALSGPVWSDEHDPRVTPFGRFLRNTHLDEFPQLINVALGQMSLIGPRPERPEFVAKLEWELPQYRTRLKLRPGITGLPQLLLPPDDSIESVRRKLVCDLYYVRYVSPWLDLKIFCATAWHLLQMIGFYLRRLVSLPDSHAVQLSLERLIDRRQDKSQFHATLSEESRTE